MIEEFTKTYAAERQVQRRSHVGVVSSGDLELLLEPTDGAEATVKVRTKVAGHRKTWEAVLQRFFERHAPAVKIEIRDNGATPGTVLLRLEQALELACKDVNDEQ